MITKCVSVLIGNSDDKLGQKVWSEYLYNTDYIIELYAARQHFTGTSDPFASWQNACWVFDMDESKVDNLIRLLTELRIKYQQDSIAVTVGQSILC